MLHFAAVQSLNIKLELTDMHLAVYTLLMLKQHHIQLHCMCNIIHVYAKTSAYKIYYKLVA